MKIHLGRNRECKRSKQVGVSLSRVVWLLVYGSQLRTSSTDLDAQLVSQG